MVCKKIKWEKACRELEVSLRVSMENGEHITQGLIEVWLGVGVGVDKRFFEILLNYTLHAIMFLETWVKSSITI